MMLLIPDVGGICHTHVIYYIGSDMSSHPTESFKKQMQDTSNIYKLSVNTWNEFHKTLHPMTDVFYHMLKKRNRKCLS